jgi:hypothetical protein
MAFMVSSMGRGKFLNFLLLKWYITKVYISRLMRVYVGFIMLSACNCAGFFASYWSEGLENSSGIGPRIGQALRQRVIIEKLYSTCD